MPQDTDEAPQQIHWLLRLAFGVLGATATLSGPWLRAFTAMTGPPDDIASRDLPVLAIWFAIAGWGAVWLISVLVVTYQRETNPVSLAVTALGILGAFAGISVLVHT